MTARRHTPSSFHCLALLPLLGAATGCADGSFAEVESFDAAEQGIIGGDQVFTNDRGVVTVTGVKNCTGVLLNHYWVLTARQCVDTTRQTGVTVGLQGATRQSQLVIAHPSSDVALVILDSAMAVDARVSGYSMGISTAPNASFVNQTLECWGYGSNLVGGAAVHSALRKAGVTVTASTPGATLTNGKNVRGQIQGAVDAGAPCFTIVGDQVVLAGITSSCTDTSCQQTGPEAYLGWVQDFLFNRSEVKFGNWEGAASGRRDAAFPWYGGSGVGLTIQTMKLLDLPSTELNQTVRQLGDGAGVFNRGTPLVGDFDGSGSDDLLFAWYAGTGVGLQLRTKFSRGAGVWNAALAQLPDGDSVFNMGPPLVGRFNDDNKDDIVFARYGGSGIGLQLRTKFSNGDGTWSASEQQLPDGAVAWNRGQPLVGRFNSDQREDLVFAVYADGGLQLRTKLSQGDGTWIPQLQQLAAGDDYWQHGQPLVGNFAGNSQDDLVFAVDNGGLELRTLISDSSGKWKMVTAYLGDGAAIWNMSSPVAADVNGDGKDDIVFAYKKPSGQHNMVIRTRLSKGNGTWSDVIEQEFGDGMVAWSEGGPFVADTDGDGREDLIFPTRVYGRTTMRVRRSVGNGTYEERYYDL